jgi:transcriptional regulator with XRE-family HTH domain
LYYNFEKLIKKKGISPYRVSKDTGIPYATLSDWKNSKSKPKLDKLIKIANYLGVTLDELLKEESQEPTY